MRALESQVTAPPIQISNKIGFLVLNGKVRERERARHDSPTVGFVTETHRQYCVVVLCKRYCVVIVCRQYILCIVIVRRQYCPAILYRYISTV
jgi:hypothetical protein